MPAGADGNLKIGDSEIDAFYMGDEQVDAIYLGDKQVWRRGLPPQWIRSLTVFSRETGESISQNIGNLVAGATSITRISGSLPPGITFNGTVLQGNSYSPGTYTSTYRATNEYGSADATIRIVVSSSGGGGTPTTPSLSFSGVNDRSIPDTLVSEVTIGVSGGTNPRITHFIASGDGNWQTTVRSGASATIQGFVNPGDETTFSYTGVNDEGTTASGSFTITWT